MGFSNTTLEHPKPHQAQPDSGQKSASREFFSYPVKTSYRNRSNSLKTSQEKSICTYKIASGRGIWPSRDPIEEKGGVNLYGFVKNMPLFYWDVLGLEEEKDCCDQIVDKANTKGMNATEATKYKDGLKKLCECSPLMKLLVQNFLTNSPKKKIYYRDQKKVQGLFGGKARVNALLHVGNPVASTRQDPYPAAMSVAEELYHIAQGQGSLVDPKCTTPEDNKKRKEKIGKELSDIIEKNKSAKDLTEQASDREADRAQDQIAKEAKKNCNIDIKR